MEQEKRKIKGKRLVFLVLAVFFSIYLLGVSFGFVTADNESGKIIPFSFLVVFASCESALFIRLLLSREKSKGNTTQRFIHADLMTVGGAILKLLSVSFSMISMEFARQYDSLPLQLLTCVFTVALIFWIFLRKGKAISDFTYYFNDDTGAIVRMNGVGLTHIMHTNTVEWVSLPPDNSYMREVCLGQGNNCLTQITGDAANKVIEQWGNANLKTNKREYVSGNWKCSLPHMDKNEKYIIAIWNYQLGYFNEWIMQEHMKLYLESLNIDAVVRRKEIKGKYKNKDFIMDFSWQSQGISLKYLSNNEAAFESLYEIIEMFLLNGYEPADKKALEETIRKYTPVKMEEGETKSEYSDGHSDFYDYTVRLFNADDELIDEASSYADRYAHDSWPVRRGEALLQLGKEKEN